MKLENYANINQGKLSMIEQVAKPISTKIFHNRYNCIIDYDLIT